MGKSDRKDREIERVRRDILEAAAISFARKGFHGATMEDIAKQAGFGVGSSLYNYFKGKKEIYRALLEAIAHEFEVVYEDPPITLQFRQRMEWIFQRQFEIVEAHREFFVMFFSERVSFDWELGSKIGNYARERYHRWVDRMADILSQGIDEGQIRAVDPRDLAYFVVGVINATILRWISGDLSKPLKEQALVVLDLLYRGMDAPTGGP